MDDSIELGPLGPYLENLEAGAAIGHRNLELTPLKGDDHDTLNYLLAQDALTQKVLTVTEVSEGGSVPELMVTSEADDPVLLLDGEELVGAKQNRILNTSVLLPPASKTRIPVSCVEQGRWSRRSDDFASGGWSPSDLRARKSRDVSANLLRRGEARSDQGAVWEAVRKKMADLDVDSPTMAMSDARQARREGVEAYLKALPYPDEARGVLVAVDGRFVALDLFDWEFTLEKVWARLVSGYALDALGAPSLRAVNPVRAKAFTAREALDLIEHLCTVEASPHPTVGMGADWRFASSRLTGQALVAEEACVHLCAFPKMEDDEADGQGPIRRSRIQPPSRRRRR